MSLGIDIDLVSWKELFPATGLFLNTSVFATASAKARIPRKEEQFNTEEITCLCKRYASLRKSMS